MKSEVSEVINKMKAFMPFLNEEQCRLYVASEVQALGRGGKSLVNRELGISRTTVNSGIADLETSGPATVSNPLSRQRKKGGGRKNPSMIRYGKR